MSLFSWLKSAFQPPPVPDLREPEGPPPDEVLLRGLLMSGPEGNLQVEGPLPPEAFAALGRLIEAGREKSAIEIYRRLLQTRPDDQELAARLAELLCARLEHASAIPLLDKLTASPGHRLRAHFLLGEAFERAGDERGARRHFERVLAIDLDYPQARHRADRLQPTDESVTPPPPEAMPTLAGLPSGGADFGGRYRLIREIGRGASGAVYLAEDQTLGRQLALKILHPQTRSEAHGDARTRAFIEARIAAAIRHPGVVAIYDLDEERHLVAMELCTGGSLNAPLLKGPLPPRQAVARIGELLATLAAVHRRGVVHGDLKPANLLFRDAQPDADLVLGDFGVARLTHESRPAIEQRAARGTLAYMAPEQRRGELTPAADLYASGVIALELLSGTRFLDHWLADRAALLRGEVRWDGTLPPTVEGELGDAAAPLRALIAQLLAPDPADRPVAEVAASEVTKW